MKLGKDKAMGKLLKGLMVASVVFASATLPGRAAETGKDHHVVFQVDTGDPATMNLTLNNVTNAIEFYRDKGSLEVDVVAFGPGLNMLRADKSPVADRIKHLAAFAFPTKVQFSACNNTKVGMERAEGHAIQLLPEATLVPAGVVQIMEREEQGWSYVRP